MPSGNHSDGMDWRMLDTLFEALEFNVARTAMMLSNRTAVFAVERAETLRTGSIGASRVQQRFYWRVATHPGVRRICEVGFNSGHSTALWLLANPLATVVTFDLFDNKSMAFMGRNAALLQRVFPGRLQTHVGNSLHTVRAADIDPPCDLVHVDGRHSYENTLLDAYNLMAKSRATAQFLFDDQCDVSDCNGANAIVASRPALAVCDLVAAELLAPVAAVYSGERQFALYREGTRRAEAVRAKRHRPMLSCARCKLNLTSPWHATGEKVKAATALVKEQDLMRNGERRCSDEAHERDVLGSSRTPQDLVTASV